ncbi:hypothetical protein R3P38DRAFT_2792979 [Favolaschia claudopus]|uniref:Uncharacterized protein n=1 Tax=Favolaschia claudopus TaxID=2862362 RepID=A0AAW0ACU8_9AGAR
MGYIVSNGSPLGHLYTKALLEKVQGTVADDAKAAKRNLESDANVNRNSAQVSNPKEAQLQQLDHFQKQPRSEFQRRSAGQRKRREREAKENSTKATRRSVAQCARRQRELAAKIEDLLDIKEHDSQQSRAQKLRRKVEQGERRLRAFPDCDHSRALDEALDREWMLNQPRRENRHRASQRKLSTARNFRAQKFQFEEKVGIP